MRLLDRIAVGLAGLLGATGVAAAAASSHAGAQLLGPYALIALTHAPALLALGIVAERTRLFDTARIALMVGAVLFCTDIACRYAFGAPPFPFAAPLGGLALMAGWLTASAGALTRVR